MKKLGYFVLIIAYMAVAVVSVQGVLRSEFFSSLIGVEEHIFAQNSELRETVFNPRNNCLVAGGNSYKFGHFSTVSIEELDSALKRQKKVGGGSFSVIEGHYTTFNSSFRDKVDIGALMVANPDAVFQVASNFNCLEPISRQAMPECGISDYIYDMTQGPLASIAAAPGLIYRMYYPFYTKGSQDPQSWRQTSSSQVNLLKDVNLPVVNGYVDLTRLTIIPDFNYKKVNVGVHKDIQLTYGFLLDSSHHEYVYDKNLSVHQVFTAGLDLGNVSGNYHYLSPELYIPVAKKLLWAAYEGVVKTAAVLGKKKVFLTLVGGGVFQNDVAWIIDAIERVVDFIGEYGLDVTLVVYRGPLKQELSDRLKKITIATDGNYQVYK